MIELWHPDDCQKELLRVEYHPGFPSGTHLRCPVFNANKKQYLLAIRQHTNPSFFLPLQAMPAVMNDAIVACKAFLKANIDGVRNKKNTKPLAIAKAPYVQNGKFKSRYLRAAADVDSLVKSLKNNDCSAFTKPHIKACDRFPYMIVQTYMLNNSETKVLLPPSSLFPLKSLSCPFFLPTGHFAQW